VAKKQRSPESEDEALDFEGALEQLEGIVFELEQGEIGLSQSLGRYEKGVKLLRRCYEMLSRAEQQISLVAGIDQEGNARLEPFDSDSTGTLEEKAEKRSRRRTKKRSTSGQSGAAGDDESVGGGSVMDDPDTLF
jgi:exodeoxyribonuclease VII small subunit